MEKQYPEVIQRNQHSMRNGDLTPNTLKVLQTLIKHNYKAYAVGGCVRDKLMGKTPKDFDVVTNATPEQIKQCFRNCRLIGRRFRLAHITFGREIIEVATFRGHHTDETNEVGKQNDDGQLIRDNIFGSIEEDAARRDFTFNALYFDVQDESILDFAHGMRSIENRRVEIIGDSEVRFREDPVRMIRAIRFACKLNMQLPADLANSIKQFSHLLANIPAARLFEEVSKLLLSGIGLITFESLHAHNLLAQLFPLTTPLLKDPNCKEHQFLINMLKNTDNRINNEQRITPAFLYAAFLWYPMEVRAQQLMFESSMTHHDAINLASADVLFQQSRRIMIPKRFSIPVREIWALQQRLQKRQGRRCLQLLTHPRFRAAYDFLLLRGSVEGGELPEIGEWWTTFQEVSSNKRTQMVNSLPNKAPRKRRKRKTSE